MTTTMSEARTVRAPRGTDISCLGWQQEAALRMLMNNLDPEVAERPEQLIVYCGIGNGDDRETGCFQHAPGGEPHRGIGIDHEDGDYPCRRGMIAVHLWRSFGGAKVLHRSAASLPDILRRRARPGLERSGWFWRGWWRWLPLQEVSKPLEFPRRGKVGIP